MVRGWPAFKRVMPILWLMLNKPDLDLLGPYRRQVSRRRPDARHFDQWPVAVPRCLGEHFFGCSLL